MDDKTAERAKPKKRSRQQIVMSLTTNLSVLDSYPRAQQILPVHFIHGIIRIPAKKIIKM
jgi:hypothetical protein